MKSLVFAKDLLPITKVARVVEHPDKLIILGCGSVRVAGKWTMLTLREATVKGAACGGLHRVEAAAALYLDWPSTTLVPTSSRSALDNNSAEPNQWEVESRILQDLGVPSQAIKPEKRSINTVTQLSEVVLDAANEEIRASVDYYLITNRYHLPRVQVMLTILWLMGENKDIQKQFKYESKYTKMMRSLINQPQKGYVSGLLNEEQAIISRLKARKVHFYLLAAEDVLKMQDVEKEVALEQYFINIVAAEENGLRQLLAGTYGR